jgi:hypothetical protein
MKRPTLDIILRYYHQNRRANFAASQRLEGIEVAATIADKANTLPNAAELKKKYAVTRR